VGVLAGGMPVVTGTQAFPMKAVVDAAGQTTAIQVAGTTAPMTITDGQLAGLLEVANQTLPDLRRQVDALAQQLIRRVDEIHATAIPLSGSFANLASQRPVKNVAVPLAQAGLSFAPRAGTLYVSVTNQATGTRVLTPVAVDPATQSLQDVATALSAVPHIQAVVDGQTGLLHVLAQPGYAFDFAGQLPTVPETTAITGTTVPQLSGTYTGTANDHYTFTVVGSGTVGVTSGLSLEVRDQSGALQGTFNIGGYTAGAALSTVNGVRVQLSAGTVNNGDSFAVSVVANADPGGLLSALGMNAFFQGDDAATVQVRPDLLAQPGNLALSLTGQPGDGGALQQLAALRDAPVLSNGTQSLQQYLASLIGAAGQRVQDLTQQQGVQQTVAQRLQAEQQSLSGVDPNEELVRLMQFQQAFQMAAHYVSVLDTSFAALLQIT
jgi:flagellar hook-associated protein FlgK